MNAIWNFITNIIGVRTTVFKHGSTYMVKEELMLSGFILKTTVVKAADAVTPAATK